MEAAWSQLSLLLYTLLELFSSYFSQLLCHQKSDYYTQDQLFSCWVLLIKVLDYKFKKSKSVFWFHIYTKLLSSEKKIWNTNLESIRNYVWISIFLAFFEKIASLDWLNLSPHKLNYTRDFIQQCRGTYTVPYFGILAMFNENICTLWSRGGACALSRLVNTRVQIHSH